MPLINPTLLPEAFAVNALPANITSPLPTPATGTNAASWSQGFPPITMTPKASGGLPPLGADVNGVLNAMSAHTTFLQQGGFYKWDATLGAAGYAKGSVLQLDDNSGLVISAVDANTLNPNTSASLVLANQWRVVTGAGTRVARYVSRIADAFVTTFVPAITVAPAGDFPVVLLLNGAANVGSVTCDLGWGPLPVYRTNGTALTAGDLVAVSGAGVYATYSAVAVVGAGAARASYLQLTAPVTSQISNSSHTRAAYGTTFASANPAGKMLGAGSATTIFTPSKSGVCLVTMCGAVYDTSTEGVGIVAKFGTGVAPVLGAALVGTSWAGAYQPFITTGSAGGDYSFTDILTLVPGTAYWFDLGVTNAAGTVNMPNGTFTIVEL